MTIQLLPEEVLVEIFSYFNRFEDVRRIGLVCRTWHRLAWSSLTKISLKKFPNILEGNQFQYLLRSSPYISELHMPPDATDNHICKIGWLLPHIKVLSLRRCREITNVGLEYLETLRLEEIYLSTSWNISNLDFLAGSASTLKTLELRGCDLITDDCLQSLLEKISAPFESLKFLDLRDCDGLTDEGFAKIPQLFPNLVQLDASGCKITISSIENLGLLKKLEKLYLWGCQYLDDSAMEVISRYPGLKKLSTIECDALSDIGFRSLARSKTIEWLEIGSKGATDKGIDWILNLMSLRSLNVISNTLNITKEHLESAVEVKKPDLQWRYAQLAA